MKLVNVILLLAAYLIHCNVSAHSHQDESRDDKNWFTKKDVDDGVILIRDGGFDNIYVIEGSEKVLVVDTGVGYKDLKKYIRSFTNKPLLVVNSHAHPDHAGGNHAFSHVYLHKNEVEPLEYFTSERIMRLAYEHFIKKPFPTYLEADQINTQPELTLIEQGFEFNLGDRVVAVYDIPGHTQGSIALYDSKTKSLFTGDSTTRMVWLHPEMATTVEDYLNSVVKMKNISNEISQLYAGHGDPEPPTLLEELEEVAKSILSGECSTEIYESFAGNGEICATDGAQIVFNPERIRADIPR